MGRIYLVTGAAGHLGNTLLRLLHRRGEQVRALALPGEPIGHLESLGARWYRGDVRDPATLEEFLDLPAGETGIVLHCAGIVSTTAREDSRLYGVNVEGARNVGELCLQKGLTMVHVSSVHALPTGVPGMPIQERYDFDPAQVSGAYAESKAAATAALLELADQGLDVRVVHPSGILGPYDFGKGHLTQLVLSYLNGGLTACVEGGYDFVDVRDVAAGVVAAAEQGRAGECYILSGHFVRIQDALNEVSRASGHKPIHRILPMWFAKGTAPLAECYYKLLKQPPLYSSYSLEVLTSNGLFDCTKARRELGYAPRPFARTVEDTVRWLASQGRIRRPLTERKESALSRRVLVKREEN